MVWKQEDACESLPMRHKRAASGEEGSGQEGSGGEGSGGEGSGDEVSGGGNKQSCMGSVHIQQTRV